jgi:hypothetical protein
MNENQIISINEFASERLTVKQKVYRLIQRFPYLLEHQVNMLVYFYWYFYDESFKIIQSDGKIELQKFHRLTPAESITRALRELIESGRVKSNWKTINIKAVQESKYHHYYATRKIESL